MDEIDRVAAAMLAMPAFPDAYGAQHWEEDRPLTLGEWLDGTHIHDSAPDLMRRAAMAAIQAMSEDIYTPYKGPSYAAYCSAALKGKAA